MAKEWTAMTSDEKIEMLTAILQKAATDISIRDRLLGSPESALAAIREMNHENGTEVTFPPDFSIRFLPQHATAKATNTVILKAPPFFPNTAPTLKLDEYLICTYLYWREGAEEAGPE